jgi:toxin FitB
MIVLDTNILSGVVSDKPNPAIVDWLNRQKSGDVATTSITYYESWMGIEKLGPSRRRAVLEAAFAFAMEKLLGGRILPLDAVAARAAAILAANRESGGRPIEIRDTLIAGVVIAHNASLATGNTRHFLDAGIPLVNPLTRA